MYKALFSLLIFFSVSAKSQTQDSVSGNWKFVDITNAEGLDSTTRINLMEVFKDLEIHLNKDKTYAANFFKKEEGKWAYNDKTKVLTLTNEKKEDKINILAWKDKRMTLEMKKGVGIILEKQSPD